ncbi:dicarboxylate/amino acid:cation symporter [Sphingomonas desiccabilis]|uniref:Dicarboxylate/amino acid:cation symporter n=1 Tax=Sphingomonas desiccabilis TaxID=429134 RepID=A0A4V1QNL8_9SPHN|nr:dicarboxylate/amino acid:cation symporter [Sphingomonas desiccabilis]MBB3912576.1 Na+/H+-dicarboxylate symporter [Sphingomonas desiccabilis]RXZ29869.1 dicarboxylate/amino acid:cation symporter [Sphingomonas desiccabilis]
MSLTHRILAALIAGLVVGLALTQFDAARAMLTPAAELIGKAWVGGLRITIVPLVFALIVTGVASAADTARAGGVAGRALLFIAIGLTASALVSGLVVQGLLSIWPVPAGAIGSLGLAQTLPPQATAITGDWLLSFIPTNPVKSAAEGEMVPLVAFALLFGFAATRIDRNRCAGLIGWFQSVTDTLMVIVHWVLWLAPVGVFALATVAGARAGLAAAGTLVQYIVVVVSACIAVTLLVYPVVRITSRLGIAPFARAIAPAQVIAFSTQSSIASLPAMIEAARGPLGIREPVRNMVLPMAVSIFRITSAAANFAVALYVAALHGIAISPGLFAAGMLVATIVSLAAVGLPSQVSFFTTIGPVCLAMGVPIELLPLLLAVETVPDIFRTLGNVTADLGLTLIVDRQNGAPD